MLCENAWSALRLMAQVTDRRQRLRIAAATLLVAASGVLAAMVPLALKRLVDAVAPSGAGPLGVAPTLTVAATVYVAALCGGRLLADLRPLLTASIDQHMIAALRRQFFEHVLRLPLGALLRRKTGELLHHLDLASTGLQLILAHAVQSIVPVVAELVVMTVVLVQLGQPSLVALFTASAVLYAAVFTLAAKPLNRRARAVTTASIEVNGQLAAGMANVETLRCFCAETSTQETLARASSSLIATWLHYYRASSGAAMAATTVFAVSLAACFAITANGVARGSLTVGGFVLGGVYLLQMVRPIEVLGSAVRDLARAWGFVEPMLAVLREPREPSEAIQTPAADVRTAWGPSDPAGHPPSIRLEGLTFAHAAGRVGIRDLDLHMAAGTTTGIVGPSGSGKSTLLRLLLRLHTPQAGRILLDERPIDSLPLHQLRSMMALVPQDTPLLHTSIAANISLGMPGTDDQAIEEAAKAAQLQDLIESMPEGYATRVGDRGHTLSGGERQRVAIARAALRRPSVFLLDEPTSMLDSETEAQVLHSLRALTQGCTTLIVAHRLSTVAHADQIIVLDQGRIREQGRHQELLARGGLYAQLWRLQAQGAV